MLRPPRWEGPPLARCLVATDALALCDADARAALLQVGATSYHPRHPRTRVK